MDQQWLCWIYQYAVGGAIFATAVLLALRGGALKTARVNDRRALVALVAGFVGFAAVHATWISLVIGKP